MINTMFLNDQTEAFSKSFSSLSVPILSSARLSGIDKFKIAKEISSKTLSTHQFNITDGRVDLHQANQIFNIEHVSGNVDIVLPKAKNMLDWVVLWYDQDKTIFNVSYEGHSKIKLYGNGSRIMGLDEPMICDMPFMSLRLTFVNDIDGWIVT